ncbi:MAG: hybrid sensor histidine kinase/response regulator [Desulfobacterales bacterium]|nr:hybrid sensor histidine kinase/response regulator [Desulfobacterales bacterium]
MSDISNKSILVVDDTVANLDILVETLGDLYNVRAATNGVQALEEINEEKPDLILLDILMPEMDGYEVCTRLKSAPETRDILIIFVTSLAEAVDETRGFELGAVDYITKPFSDSVVRARVKTHLELAEARLTLERQNEVLKENINLREQVEQVTRHDLKNPLQVILTSAQIMNAGLVEGKEDVRDLSTEQIAACDTMLNMINRSLDLYKLENGTYRLNREEADILPMLDRIIAGGSRYITPLNLQVDIIINGAPRQSGDRFPLSCDPLLFYSMMSNLVTNALEASPRNGTIAVALESGNRPVIYIENRGAVPPGIRHRFFEKFVTEGKRNGTGLGTYSARLTADIHGADIRVHASDAADTTRITIHWPSA